MKNKVIDILKNNSQKSVIGFAVEEDDFDMVAQKLVKLFSIHNVVGRYSQEEIEAAYHRGLEDGYACVPSNL